MEDLYTSQVEIYEAIKKLATNIKKDSKERKTIDYCKRRLENLEAYWVEYQHNHDRMTTGASRTHRYFTDSEFDKTKELYTTTKLYLAELLQSLKIRSVAVLDQQGTTSQGEEYLQATTHTQGGSEEPRATNSRSQLQVSEDNIVRVRSQGSPSKLDEMLRKQWANFKAFNRTVANIDVDSLADKWEFDDALKTLHTRWTAIDTLHWELDSELNGEDEEYDTQYTRCERKFNTLKKEINVKLWANSHREKTLPKLDIPEFSGQYNQWVSFKDLFQEAIHNNPSLSKAQKMQFLKGKVKGEAERLIHHLTISSENYEACWDILNHRYNNKKLIFTSHMNILLGLPTLQQQSLGQIKKMHDVTIECLHAIKNLGADVSTWDPILVHILSQKLDSETYTEYIESIKTPRELPILQEFLDYLENKFTSLESSRRKQDSKYNQLNNNNSNYQAPSNKKPYYTVNKITSQQPKNNSISSKFTCPLCKQNHGLYHCNQFINMSNEAKLITIRDLHVCRNCLFSHSGNKCISTKRCRVCGSNHNTMLHEACTKAHVSNSNATASKPGSSRQNEHVAVTSHVSQNNFSEILLATAKVKVMAADGTYLILKTLIDQGSQLSLVSEHAAQRLGIKRERLSGTVFGIGHMKKNCKGSIKIKCSSLYDDYTFDTEVLIMSELIKNLPNKTFSKPSWPHIQNIQLADPEFYISSPIDLLLGADIYSAIMMGGIIKGENSTQPIVQQTHLGWLLCGNITTHYHCNVVINNLEDIKQFWEIENINEQTDLTSNEQQCVDYYKQTTKRLSNGRYEVKLPFYENIGNKLGSTEHIAIAQFKNLEKKFKKHPILAREYKQFFREYEQLNHMTLSKWNTKPEFVLPHHCVERPESTTTKYRAVFNASIKSTSGHSLNDLMHKGPNLQQDLQLLILKWRQYKYGYVSDLEKMYRQILLSTEHQQFHKVIWRYEENQPLKKYQLTTVTYGTKAAPFLAMMTLRQLAADERHAFPDAAKVVEESFFMDDLVHGCSEINEGKHMIKQLRLLLSSGGFNLRKWSSNEPKLFEDDHDNDDQQNIFNFKTENTSKILGLGWNPKSDNFLVKYDVKPLNGKLTKREILSEISKLFDPLGWLTPLTTKLKILFQNVCSLHLAWDDVIPDDINNEWHKLRADMININNYEVPRWIGCNKNDNIQLHGFCDASQNAYACVIYACLEKTNHINIISAKSKLVPASKTFSIPQLELCSAQLLSKLMKKVVESLKQHNLEVFGWSDSMVVLAWLQSDPGRFKKFVTNRVREILQVIPKTSWRYVKSNENPAESASRGIFPSQLKENGLYWKGPAFLTTFNSDKCSNIQKYSTNEQQIQIKQVNMVTDSNRECQSIINILLNKYSSLSRLIRVLAWVKRFINKKQNKKQYLILSELREASITIIKHMQSELYKEEIKNLKTNKNITNKSKILNLNPYLDSDGILRVGGRLKHANIHSDMKNPIIIDKNSRLATLIILHAHKLTFHGGARVTSAFIRQKYWIVGGNREIKKQLHRCVTCKKHDPIKNSQIMGSLPSARSNPSRPFFKIGVDYTGYISVKCNKGRGIKTSKGYIAVFVCMATKAVHLELVSDMTTSTFLAALRRMAARRGTPGHIYSDQGTNFIKGNRILQEEFHKLTTENNEFMSEISEMGIIWHHNCPLWPSAGGLWEGAVKSLKYHTKRVIGDQHLTYEEYSTLLAQLEAVLNSRPLCPISEDPDDLNFLTPSHFLTNGPTLTIYETERDLRTRWYLTQKIFEDIWKRWKTEYLSQLTARSKWRRSQPNIKLDDIVIIHDANLPAGKWALGRVVQLHTGSDGKVRVVTLKTKNGLLKRPIIKLSILPTNPEEEKPEEYKGSEKNESENSEQETIDKERRVRNKPNRFCMVTTFTSIILFFMTLLTSADCKYNITNFPANRSLYYDKISHMNLIRDEWKLVVYYNLTPYWDGTREFTRSLKYLENICLSIKEHSPCGGIILQLRYGETELEYYNNMILSQHFREQTRQKRGLVDGVGYLANSLFGILDSRFAEKYKEDIALIKTNENHLARLLKNQTTVVEAEFNLLKRIEEIMTKQHKELNFRINQMEKAINKIETEIQRIKFISDFSMCSLMSNNVLTHLKDIQNMILDTLTNLYQGHFDPHLLTPHQLTNELDFISGKLPSDLSLPVDTAHLPTLYNLLRIHGRISDEYMIFEIKIPLVNRDKYDMFRILPIPQKSNNNMITIQPVAEYVAINLKKDSLLTLKENEMNSCLHLNPETQLCEQKHPVYHIQDDETLCQTIESSRTCKTTISSCTNIWEELNEPNKYFYFCCIVCPIKLLCENQMTTLQLTRAGLLIVSPECVIKTKDFMVYPHRQMSSILQTKIDSFSIEIPPINHILNIEIPYENQTFNSSESEQIPKEQLENIQKQIEILHKNSPFLETVSYHDIHHYVVIYIVVAIIAAVGFLFAWRRVQRRSAATAQPQQQSVQCESVVMSHLKECDSVRSDHANLRPSLRPNVQTRKNKKDRGTSPVLRSVQIISDESSS